MSGSRSFDKTLSIVLIIILIIAVAATIYIAVFPQPNEKFTEFYILGPDGKAGNYPTNLTTNETGKVIIGIVNHEASDVKYQIIVKFNSVILKNDTISLKDKEKKEIPLTFTVSNSGQNQTMDFLLYKLPNNINVYRSLQLIVDVN